MSDHGELRRLAEAIHGPGSTIEMLARWREFEHACEPKKIISLLSEIEGLRDQNVSDALSISNLLHDRDDSRKERDRLLAEVEALRSQVATLQSDANSWQSGYDEGRRMGTKTALDEREQLRKDADRYRWMRQSKHFDSPQHQVFCEFYAVGLDVAIDEAISKGEQP